MTRTFYGGSQLALKLSRYVGNAARQNFALFVQVAFDKLNVFVVDVSWFSKSGVCRHIIRRRPHRRLHPGLLLELLLFQHFLLLL